MVIRGVVTTYLVAGLTFAIWSEAAFATPLAGAIRGQNVTRISNDRGGYVIQYGLRMEKLKQAGTRVQFAGPCLSACTLYLALPSSQTCISPRASFSFHAAYGAGPRGNAIATSYMLNKYPGWVRNWIISNGGLSRRLITMKFDYASKHMKTCKTTTVQSQPRTLFKKGVRALRLGPTKTNFPKAASI